MSNLSEESFINMSEHTWIELFPLRVHFSLQICTLGKNIAIIRWPTRRVTDLRGDLKASFIDGRVIDKALEVAFSLALSFALALSFLIGHLNIPGRERLRWWDSSQKQETPKSLSSFPAKMTLVHARSWFSIEKISQIVIVPVLESKGL